MNLIILLAIVFLSACADKPKIGEIPMEVNGSINSIKLFQNTNIYFGHKSVGNNVIEGIKEIAHANNISNLSIYKLDEDEKLTQNYFVHSSIGKNGDPISKIKEFQKNIELLTNKNLKVAMMKFCFADFDNNSDINGIFQTYVTATDSIKNKYPNLHVIHFTVPLKAEKSFLGKLKAFAKGESDKNFYDNLARNKYNDLICSNFSAENIFDIAKIESTYSDGEREIKNIDGEHCYFLINEYSRDGSHLNEFGQKLVANELINCIAKIKSGL